MTDKPQRQRCPSSSYIRAIDGDVVSNVKVVVRIRPPNAAEQTEKSRIVVHPINENVLVFDPLEQSKDGAFRNGPRDIRKRRNKDMKFAFDYIFGLNSTNVDVFEQTTKTILDGLLQGYNCSGITTSYSILLYFLNCFLKCHILKLKLENILLLSVASQGKLVSYGFNIVE